MLGSVSGAPPRPQYGFIRRAGPAGQCPWQFFRKREAEYDVREIAESFAARFQNIIEVAHAKTGRPVVILVDEYDKPLVSNINNAENIEHYRNRLSAIYSNLKSSAVHIRMVFLTGVSRFSKLSIFSDLNNIMDITVKTEDYIYVIELKYDGSAEEALDLIDRKKNDRKYQMDGRQIIRIDVNFSSETRCIEDWKIETGD